MSQIFLVLVHLLLTSRNICQEHGKRLQSSFDCSWRICPLPSFFPHEGKEEIEKELQSLGSSGFLKSSFCSSVLSTLSPFNIGRKKDVNYVRENCNNWEGDGNCLGSGLVFM